MNDKISLGDASIGTKQEKSLHKIIKNRYCPDLTMQEVKIDSWIVDIFLAGEIIEIQTGNFYAMKKKLAALLPKYKIKIVYPMASEKYIHWIDPLTKEELVRKSPKKYAPLRIAKELYQIKQFLNCPNLTIEIIALKIDEYRYLDGYAKDGKKGSTKVDQVPGKILEQIILASKEDYFQLLPALPINFTSSDIKKALNLSNRELGCAIQVLKEKEVIKHIGKKGRAYLYEINY